MITPNSLTSSMAMTSNNTMVVSGLTWSASNAMSRYAILRRALSSSGLESYFLPTRGAGTSCLSCSGDRSASGSSAALARSLTGPPAAGSLP